MKNLPKTPLKRRALPLLVLALGASNVALAQEAPEDVSEPIEVSAPQGAEQLQQRVQNPFSDIQGVILEQVHIENQEGFGDEDSNITAVRLFSSFKIGDGNYIARVITPFANDLAFGGDGIGDTTIAVAKTETQNWGVIGYGVQAVAPTGNSDFSNDGWRLGPVVGAVRLKGPLQYGAINFNEFTVSKENGAEDVNLSRLQLLGSYHLGRGFTVGLSEMNFVYDWEKDKFTNVPLGMGVSQIIPFENVITRVELAYEHDFSNGIGGDGDTIRAKFTFLKR